jgi:hypothetical protein
MGGTMVSCLIPLLTRTSACASQLYFVQYQYPNQNHRNSFHNARKDYETIKYTAAFADASLAIICQSNHGIKRQTP